MRGTAAFGVAVLTAAALAVLPPAPAAAASPAATHAPPTTSAQQNAAHDGLTTQTLTGDLRELWHRDFHGRPSVAVVADGRVFTVVGQYTRVEGASLYAFDLATGAVLWGPMDLGGNGYGGLPAYDGGRVYVMDTLHAVHAYDAATGAHLWGTPPVNPGHTVHEAAWGLVADKGVVYARAEHALRAIDGVTGTQLWRSAVSLGSDGNDIPTLTPDSVVFSAVDDEMAAVDRVTGATRWVEHGCCTGGLGVEPAYSGGRLYAVQNGTNAPSRVLDAATGKVLVNVLFDGIPAVAPERLVLRRDGAVVSVDPVTYATQWTFDPPADPLSPPIVTPDRVFVGGGSVLYALDRDTGAVESSLDLGAAFTPRPRGHILQTQGITVADETAVVTTTNRLTVVGGASRTPPPPPPPPPPLDGPRTGPERAPAPTSWTSLRGDAGHSGAQQNEIIETPLTHRWTTDLAAKVRQVTALDGRVFVGYWGPPGDGMRLDALDMRDGRRLWGPVRIQGDVSIEGDRLYHYGTDGRFHGLDVRTGLEVFTSDPAPGGGAHAVVADGRVYASANNLVMADTTTGDVSSVPNVAADAAPAVGMGLVVLSSYCGYGTVAYDAVTLAKRWGRPTSCYGSSTHTVAGGAVYTDLRLDSHYRLNATNGAVERTRFLDAVPSVDGSTVVGVTGYGLAAWDETTGARRWVAHDDGTLFGTPVVANGLVFAQSTTGALYAYDEGDGRLRWTDPGVGAAEGVPCCIPPPGLAVAQSQLLAPAGTKVALYGPSDVPPPAPGLVPVVRITEGPGEGSWTTSSATFAFETSSPATSYSCTLDGAAHACGESLSLSGLGHGAHTLRVSATTHTGRTAEVARTWHADAHAPAVTVARPSSPWTRAPSAKASWDATDEGTGVASYDVRVRTATATSDLGEWTHPAALQGTTTQATSFALPPGRTACWSVRARDVAGNVAAWSAQACRTAPLDDRAFSASGWARGTGASWYAGTVTTTRTHGVALSRTSLRARRIALVALRCPTCGAVRVRWNGTVVATVDLRAAASTRAVIPVALFGTTRTGTLRVEVTSASGRLVAVDGIAAGPV